MTDPAIPGTPDRPAGESPPGGATSQRSVALTLLLLVVAVWAIWTSVSLLGHAIDTCLTDSGQTVGAVAPSPGPSQAPDLTLVPSASPGQEAAAAATTNTDQCMSGEVTLALTGVTFNDLPFDLLLVRLPWVAVMVLLWLVYRDRYVPDARTLDMFTASGWIGPAFVGSLVMFLVGTVLLVPRLL